MRFMCVTYSLLMLCIIFFSWKQINGITCEILPKRLGKIGNKKQVGNTVGTIVSCGSWLGVLSLGSSILTFGPQLAHLSNGDEQMMILSPKTLVVEIKDALKLRNNDLNHRQKDRILDRGCLCEEGKGIDPEIW